MPGSDPDTSISGRRVARELTTLIERRDKPGMIVSDNGTELTSNAILAWSRDHKVEWHYIALGKPMQNGYVESSTVGCVTSASTRGSSSASIMPAAQLLNELTTITISGHTHHSDIRPRQALPGPSPQPAPTLRKMKASRFRRLLPSRHLAYSKPPRL
ncbi:transposase InsO family protein [Agrobacterium larrymoorei]|uniref:Transposase InsO family protein n=1 Tax=Agrobacterium larrymoorei TaxID=160699 RepID=A0AAJ2BBJ6_9HYPH|nr:transposase InsO family protein [Agrobacterium larrymoorei]